MAARRHPASRLTYGYWSGLSALHTAVLLFGLAGLFGKWITAPPILIVFGRVIVATCAFAVLFCFRPRQGPRPARDERWWLLACGALLAFHWVAFFQSIQLSTVALGLLAYSTAPVFVVMLEPLSFREPLSYRALLCAALTVAGVALIVPRWEAGDALARGVGWGVLAGLSFAVLSLLNRRLVRRLSSIQVAFYQDVAALIVLAPLLPWAWQPLGAGELALLAVLGIFCTALAHTLFIQAMTVIKARMASITSALEPVYGIALAWLLLDEAPAARTLLGGALILSAVLWATERPPSQP